MPPLVKKNSVETHVSSPFITEQVIGYDRMLEDQEHSMTVLFSAVYHVPFCFGFFPPLPVSSAELSTTLVCSLMLKRLAQRSVDAQLDQKWPGGSWGCL